MYYYNLVLQAFDSYPQIQMIKRTASFNQKGAMKFPFKMVTVGGNPLSAVAENFDFTLLKSGKKIKVQLPSPAKTKTGGWILKLDRDSAPVIGELIVRGAYNVQDVNPPIVYNVQNILFYY